MLPTAAYQLAEQQLGVIARVQLRRWLRETQIDHRIGAGRELRRLDHGVYVVNGAGRRPIHPALAAALRAGSSSAVTGPVVLGHLGVDHFVGTELFEVLTPRGRRLRTVAFPHRRDPDPGRPVSRLGDVRLVGPTDALIDTAIFVGQIGERSLRIAYDHLRWRGLLRPERLVARLQELGSAAPGGAILRELLEIDGLDPESEPERELGRLLRVFEPAPEPQVYVIPQRRVDWYFRSLRFAYEYAGSVDHTGVASRLADDRRQRELADQGIRIGYVTSADLKTPDTLLASIIGQLAVRAHELGVPGVTTKRAGAPPAPPVPRTTGQAIGQNPG